MNSVLNSVIYKYRIVILIIFGALSGIVSTLFPCYIVMWLFLPLWFFIYKCELLDSLFLFLVIGTFAFGRAFSILAIGAGTLQVFITEFIFLIVLAIIVYRGRVENIFLRFPRSVKFGLLVYLLLGIFYLIFGLYYNGAIAFRDVVFCVYPLFLFLTMIVFNEEEKLKIMFWIIMPGVILSLINSFRIILVEDGFILYGLKGFNFVLYCGLIMVFGLSYLSYSKRYRFVSGLLVILSLSLVIFLRGQSGWIATAVSLVFFAVMMKMDCIKYLKNYGLLFVFFMLLLVLVINVFSPQIISEMGKGWYGLWHWGADAESANNIRWRISVWKQTIDRIIEKPFLGWGFGAQPGYYLFGALVVNKGIGLDSGILPPHNHLLAITFKMGLVGLALFLFINIRIFFYGLRYVKQCKSDFNRRFLVASLTGIIYWHVVALFFDVIDSPPTSIFIWILLGLVLSVVYVDRNVDVAFTDG